MTKTLNKIKKSLISKALEKMVKENTGKTIKIVLHNVNIEADKDTVYISLDASGTVLRSDFEKVAPFLGI